MSDSLWPHELQHVRPPCPSQLLESTQTHVHQVGDAIQPSHSLSSPSPPAFNLSHIRVFSNESALHIRWPKYWSFSFSISPSNEYSGLISFRIDWSELLAVQETLKSLLQHHSSKASVLQHSAFHPIQWCHSFVSSVFDSVCDIKANTNIALKPMRNKKWEWVSNLALRFEGWSLLNKHTYPIIK